MSKQSAQKVTLINRMPNLQMIRDAGSVMAPHLRPDRLSYPYRMTLVVSRACNSRCQMCNIWQQDELPQLTPEQLRTIFGDNDFWFLRSLTVTGGEPTMRKDLPEVFEAVIDGCPNLEDIYLATSALNTQRTLRFVDEMYAMAEKTLTNFKSFEVQISVDGVGPVHDEVRGIDGFFGRLEKTLDGLEALQEKYSGLKMRLSTVILPYNIHDVDNLRAYAESRGLPIQFVPVVISGSYYENSGVQERIIDASNKLGATTNGSGTQNGESSTLNEDHFELPTQDTSHTQVDVATFFSELAQSDPTALRFHYHDIVRMFGGSDRSRNCMMGFYDFVLEHNADMFACVNCEDYRFGNLLESSFDEAWFGTEAVQAREQLRTHCCPTCPSPCHYPAVSTTELLQVKLGGAMQRLFR